MILLQALTRALNHQDYTLARQRQIERATPCSERGAPLPKGKRDEEERFG